MVHYLQIFCTMDRPTLSDRSEISHFFLHHTDNLKLQLSMADIFGTENDDTINGADGNDLITAPMVMISLGLLLGMILSRVRLATIQLTVVLAMTVWTVETVTMY